MNKQGTFRHTLLALALAALGVSGTALAVNEVEPNNIIGVPPHGQAQMLEVGSGGSVDVYGEIKNASPSQPDVDFYSFQGNDGDIISVDIDNTTNGLDTVLHLFGPGPTYVMRWRSLDEPLDPVSDPGSTNDADARIVGFRLDSPGIWTVAVSADPAYLTHGGGFMRTSPRAFSNGTYKLIISGLKPAVQNINIDVKPGSDVLHQINPKAKGVIPVALLSSIEFDPFEVEPTSLTFGVTGNEASLSRCVRERQDFNADGKPDLVCNFNNEHTNFARGDQVGVVKGKTKSGKAFIGRGDLKAVPEKREK